VENSASGPAVTKRPSQAALPASETVAREP
jgi:hypothetical protein